MQLASPGASPGSIELTTNPFEASTSPSLRLDALARRIEIAWGRLVASNTTLFFILLAANAWALPYSGLVHDARLYAIQLVNRIDGGSFSGDLYLRFGTQDRYTLFSTVAAPLVQMIGLKPAFLFIYFVSVATFLWGTQRLVLALCSNRTVASLALLFLATTHVTFAGLETFYVNENFVTPRLSANGLILWALALLLEQRGKTAFLLILAAFGLHPLMACGGLLVFVAYLAIPRLSKWQTLSLTIFAAVGCALLFVDSLAGRWLGHMDDLWREASRRANPYNFPAEWAGQDWFHLLVALGIALAACASCLHGTAKRLVACVAGVGVAGILVNTIACQLPYALPMQGQGYRWLWLLQYLQVPLGFLVIRSWWGQGAFTTRAAATILAAYLGSLLGDRQQFLALLVSLTGFGVFLAAWQRSSLSALALCLGVLSLGWLIGHEAIALRAYWLKAMPKIDVIEFIRTAPEQLFAFTRLVLASILVLGLTTACRSRRAQGAVLIAAALLLQVGYFAASWHAESTRPSAGVRMVGDFLKNQHLQDRPTVYWPLGWINPLWFDLQVESYFEGTQIAGNIFNRQNALEGERRSRLVKRFELDRVRNTIRVYSPLQLQQIETQFHAPLSEPGPGWDDVETLAADPRVDYLVLLQAFPGRFAATDGSWYLYDCQAIRSAHPRSDNSTKTSENSLP